jgi:hypothetical protein
MQAISKGESFLKKLPINQYEHWAISSQGESEKILRMRRSDETLAGASTSSQRLPRGSQSWMRGREIVRKKFYPSFESITMLLGWDTQRPKSEDLEEVRYRWE